MGFLNIFKKKPKQQEVGFEDLDLPPAPPIDDIGGISEEHEFDLPPPPPPVRFSASKPAIPQPEEEFPDMDFDERFPELEEEMKQEEQEDTELPEIPVFTPEEIVKPAKTVMAAEPKPIMPSMPPKLPAFSTQPETYSFGRQRISSGVFRSGTRLYVKLDKFRDSMLNMNSVRLKIRESEELFKKLDEIKTASDKSLNNFNSIINDMQKKLTYIDKKLFRGGG